MAWTLASIIIHVDDDSSSLESLYSQQNVLDSIKTTLGYYGAKSVTRTIGFTLIEDTAGAGSLTSLKTATTTNADVVLVSDLGSEGNFRITKLSYQRVQALNHTLPVYRCSVDLVVSE
jgi:hypothetical protein